MKIPQETLQISPGAHWVGVKDWDRRMFDRLIPLPNGTSYNAYLVQGEKKTALIDSVNPGFEESLEKKVRKISDPEEIDYFIMNHAEPDHANAISNMLSLSKNGEVLTTGKGKELAHELHYIEEENIREVKDGETLNLGEKTLRFIKAPWLHWPETMLTFYEEEGILFPCDFFGSHLASGKFYDEEIGDEVYNYAKSYYGEIMMPFNKMVRQALDKIEDLDIEMIAPSHGPIHKNPERIIEHYRKWSEGEVKEKVLIIYISMWGSTEKLVKVLTETIASENVEIVPVNLATTGLGKIAGEIVDSAGIIIGTPTVLGGSHPKIHHVAYLAKKLNPPTDYLGVVESHGWSGGAVFQLTDMLGDMDAEVVGSVGVLGSPEDEDIRKVINFGKEFANKVKKD
ncbi:metallo-beta-lactamase [candidate division MSBL1 archaeon SCGC-AAA382C18]|uniref:Metallo-beta-lactamase n=1 Tax=candidate division MSBL1 archaeon SCGC-AAA382C18 TaxID=1698281 RepID=A0A133VKS9_9EURY|nr:metallo-beta-lactamase [candidate division MSBL1 archaeon SCGC-AAA382C18]